MSFGDRLGHGECRIAVGDTHTNGSQGRFEEHRTVTAIEGENLEFQIVFGKRTGSTGNCLLRSFWLWSRGRVGK